MSNRLTHSTRSLHQKASQKIKFMETKCCIRIVRSHRAQHKNSDETWNGNRATLFFVPSHSLLTIHTANCSRFALYSKCRSLSWRAAVFSSSTLSLYGLCPSLFCSLVRFCVLRVTTNYVLFSVCIVYRSCRQNDATFDVADIQRRFGIFIRGMNVAVHYFKLTGFSFDEHAPPDTFIHFTYDVYSALISVFVSLDFFFALGPLQSE